MKPAPVVVDVWLIESGVKTASNVEALMMDAFGCGRNFGIGQSYTTLFYFDPDVDIQDNFNNAGHQSAIVYPAGADPNAEFVRWNVMFSGLVADDNGQPLRRVYGLRADLPEIGS